jgi:hypothetical protein
MAADGLELTVEGEIWFWRGPSPYHFVTVPAEATATIRVVAPLVSYGWGMVPVRARIGATTWTTAMFPKDGRYVVPVKDAVRRAEALADGDAVSLELAIGR